MMMIRNPKLEGTRLWECVPQVGPCPNNCNQCYYNRPGAFYADTSKPLIPDPKDADDGIVRVNDGHDSNIERDKVIKVARRYKHYFFNTSIPRFDFPGPVVYTANREEEKPVDLRFLRCDGIANIMFIRLRVSASNVRLVKNAVESITENRHIPVVLTFMRYYNAECLPDVQAYELKRHILNSSWCPTHATYEWIMRDVGVGYNRLVTMCGTPDSPYCRDCRNCEHYYWIAKRRLDDIKRTLCK